MELNICHIYPDILNLYGDQGNILCLRDRAERRGITVTVTGLPLGERAGLSEYDLFFIGGGQDFEQEAMLAELRQGKGAEIKAAIEDGKTLLAICGGYQLLGSSYRTWDGKEYDFIGALDLHTVGAKERIVGDYLFRWEEEEDELIVGFENHSGRTYLGEGVRPLGRIISGHGNNGEDGTEGARYQNVFGSYSHGPILPKNPKLADRLITLALSARYPDVSLEPLDDTLEEKAHDYMVRRLSETEKK